MFFSYHPNNRGSLWSNLLLLLLAVACAVSALFLWDIDARYSRLSTELAAVEQELEHHREEVLQEQLLLEMDTTLREQLILIQSIRADQLKISRAMNRILSWLPDQVLLSLISMDGAGNLSLHGSGQTLAAVAGFLDQLEGDDAYLLSEVSPFTASGGQYHFNVQLRRRVPYIRRSGGHEGHEETYSIFR